jgi:hypothetical protein
VQHARRDAGQAALPGRRIEIGHQRPQSGRPQRGQAIGRRGQRDELDTAAQQRRGTQADIAAADDQDALPAKARGQRAKRVVD